MYTGKSKDLSKSHLASKAQKHSLQVYLFGGILPRRRSGLCKKAYNVSAPEQWDRTSEEQNIYPLWELVELCDSAGFVHHDYSRGFQLNNPRSPSQMYQTEEPTESRAESLQHSVPVASNSFVLVKPGPAASSLQDFFLQERRHELRREKQVLYTQATECTTES